jgi:membrane-associated protease RseP (regulator of RpoE activity)
MNIILAVVVTAFVLGAQGVRVPVYVDGPALLGAVVPGSPAEKAGLMPGDRITNVAGDTIATWKDLEIAIGIRRPNRDLSVTAIRTVRPSTRPCGRWPKVSTRAAKSACSPTRIRSSRASLREIAPSRPG